MNVIKFTLCAMVLLTVPAFAAEIVPEPVAPEVTATELPAAASAAVDSGGCDTARTAVESSEVEMAQSVFDPQEQLFGPTANPALVPDNPSLSCGGPFPIHSPGACTQTCAPCYRNSDCPPMWGRPQKCCSYCP